MLQPRPDPSRQSQLNQVLSDALLEDCWHHDALDAVRLKYPTAWIAGGFVRNFIWDLAFDLGSFSRPRDVDVVIFEAATRSESREREFEDELRRHAPRVNWSVRDQGRMHLLAGDLPYGSLEGALRAFPDRSSAIAVRLGRRERLEVLAPFGLDDAFAGLVRPTPAGLTDGRFQRFVARKLPGWRSRWPDVQVAFKRPRKQDLRTLSVQMPSA
jgi:hypothetical protein